MSDLKAMHEQGDQIMKSWLEHKESLKLKGLVYLARVKGYKLIESTIEKIKTDG